MSSPNCIAAALSAERDLGTARLAELLRSLGTAEPGQEPEDPGNRQAAVSGDPEDPCNGSATISLDTDTFTHTDTGTLTGADTNTNTDTGSSL
ncbi:hypothetical protein [Cereibacter sphaeroides]|uniref:hypothetical protein n=1 Tax=Cereibacter sphaeroides TaxID=1063 RepID=UPI00119266F4|nr:hypothetical protein [Cereibacter sphaeroides]GEM94360.1 hypothetical protein RSP03_34270 [Cereibacter sphaeroides]